MIRLKSSIWRAKSGTHVSHTAVLSCSLIRELYIRLLYSGSGWSLQCVGQSLITAPFLPLYSCICCLMEELSNALGSGWSLQCCGQNLVRAYFCRFKVNFPQTWGTSLVNIGTFTWQTCAKLSQIYLLLPQMVENRHSEFICRKFF